MSAAVKESRQVDFENRYKQVVASLASKAPVVAATVTPISLTVRDRRTKISMCHCNFAGRMLASNIYPQQQDHDRAQQRTASQQQQTRGEVTCEILQIPHRI